MFIFKFCQRFILIAFFLVAPYQLKVIYAASLPNDCSTWSGINVTFNNIKSPFKAQEGDVLAKSSQNSLTIHCQSTIINGFISLKNTQTSAGYQNNIIPTNISGIGVRLYIKSNAGNMSTIDNQWQPVRNVNQTTLNISTYAELIKTGVINLGSTSHDSLNGVFLSYQPYVLLKLQYGNNNSVIVPNIFLPSNRIGQIIANNCEIESMPTNINMGTFNINNFSSVGAFSDSRTFSIPIKCDDGNINTHNIRISIQGDTNTKSYRFNSFTLKPTKDVAQGIGVQILLAQESKGYQMFTPNNTMPVFLLTQGANFSIKFLARYVRYDEYISPGQADATLNVELTFD